MNKLKRKSILKVLLGGVFVFAMVFGASTTMSLSETNKDFDLAMLPLTTAQAEGNNTGASFASWCGSGPCVRCGCYASSNSCSC